jgi:hypothetical protein
MAMSPADKAVQQIFPNLRTGQYKITSKDTRDYNCLAWAAGETDRKWDPTDPDEYWPDGIDRTQKLEDFIAAYATRGYEQCNGDQFEHGYEKIAIYANQYGCQHAARQLGNGAWTSKLGNLWDIEHLTLEGVENNNYGKAVAFMKRPIIFRPGITS